MKKTPFFSSPENLLERNAINAGYKGSTHTAVKGVNKPKIREVPKSAKRDI